MILILTILMDINIPFYYEVRFSLIGHDSKNNFDFQSFKTKYIDKNPILGRKEAFAAFDEYISYLKKNKLGKDERGNLFIKTPVLISEKIHEISKDVQNKTDKKHESLPNPSNFEEYKERLLELDELYEDGVGKFREEISVVLVIQQEVLNNNPELPSFDGVKEFPNHGAKINEYVIHKIASYDKDEQAIVDNLDYELKLYDYYKFDVSNLKQTVYHYGYSYYTYDEYAEDIDNKGYFNGSPKREILKTPYKWLDKEELDTDSSSKTNSKINEEHDFSYEEIISNGESNSVEFKSVLQYDFRTNKAGSGIRYNIAKTINGFLNSNGGFLFVGINDDEEIIGIDKDYSLYENENKKDKIRLAIDDLISHYLDISLMPLINVSIIDIQGKDILVITVFPCPKPVFLTNMKENRKIFYTRANASTREIKDVEDIIDYIFNKDWRWHLHLNVHLKK